MITWVSSIRLFHMLLFFGHLYLAQLYGARFVLGVDIDNALIQAAWRRRRAVWSSQGPSLPILCSDQNAEDVVSGSKPRSNYFPASCEHEFGSLPIPPAENRGKDMFPHNISFRTADWVKTSIPEDKEGYDVVVGSVIYIVKLIRETQRASTGFPFRNGYT